jgi:hypothetical protein
MTNRHNIGGSSARKTEAPKKWRLGLPGPLRSGSLSPAFPAWCFVVGSLFNRSTYLFALEHRHASGVPCFALIVRGPARAPDRALGVTLRSKLGPGAVTDDRLELVVGECVEAGGDHVASPSRAEDDAIDPCTRRRARPFRWPSSARARSRRPEAR